MQDLTPQPAVNSPFRPGATIYEHAALEIAFRLFNERLFGSFLPDCMITLQEKGDALGSFCESGFTQRANGEAIDSIVLNCSDFEKLSDAEIFSYLARAMVSCLLVQLNHRPLYRYLDRRWASEMLAIGLVPNNGKGGMTGRNVRHSIAEDGRFRRTCDELAAMGVYVKYIKTPKPNDVDVEHVRMQKRASHTKFFCPQCECHVRGNPSTKVDCRPCGLPMLPA